MRKTSRLKILLFAGAACFITLLAAILISGLLEAAGLTVTRLDFVHKDVPEQFSGTTIAVLTDFHFGPCLSLDRAEKIVRTANDLRPDITVLLGDYTDGDRESSVKFFHELGALAAPLGVYAILGNHDYRGREDFIKRALVFAGLVVLDNRALWIERDGARIKLGGVSDLGAWHYDLAPTIADTRENDFVILLAHNPDFAVFNPEERIDLMLSGHTHGGQINLFGFSPVIPSSFALRFRAGLVRSGATSVIVSKGLGTVILPIRLGAPPEILLITMRRTPPPGEKADISR